MYGAIIGIVGDVGADIISEWLTHFTHPYILHLTLDLPLRKRFIYIYMCFTMLQQDIDVITFIDQLSNLCVCVGV